MSEARHRLQVRLTDTAVEMLDELKEAHGDNAYSTVIERAVKEYYVKDELVSKLRRRPCRRSSPIRGKQ